MKTSKTSDSNRRKISEKTKICGEEVVLTFTLFGEILDKRESYSLLIEEKGAINEEIFIEDVTDSFEGAKELFTLFYNEEVTPCSALYVLDDIMPI